MNWLKNTAGERDSMFTFAVIAFVVVTVRVVLGLVGSVGYGDKIMTFQDMDGGLAATYLGATFSAYWARRHTKDVAAKEKAKGK